MTCVRKRQGCLRSPVLNAQYPVGQEPSERSSYVTEGKEIN